MKDKKLFDSMNKMELAACWSFVGVSKNFLLNYKAEKYKQMANNVFGNVRILGINMITKMHFFHSHLNLFSEDSG